MRVKNSILNISAGIGSQIIITLLGFFSRIVFVHYLGAEYLGVNGLFSNILGMLSLAEGGIGSAIIYNLYKPVAEGNEEKINTLMNFYKKTYIVIAVVVLFLGLSLFPFLGYFVKDTLINNINLIYLLFLISTASSYLFSYKISFLNVCQKGYIVTGVYSISSIVSICIKMGILYLTHNYLLYLVVDILISVITSCFLSSLANKMYPLLRNKVVRKLDTETKANITKNVKALILHNIGGYAVFGTDNMVIASFVNIKAVGLYSNYYMLINICRTFINQIFDNITYSVGNLIAEESEEKIFTIFNVTMLLNFWIYSFFTIFLSIILETFISFWLGANFLMGKGVLIILMINFYVSGMRKSISTVKTTSGIFHDDRYAPFLEAVINLGASIFLVKYLGIAGVFLGTLISTLAVPFWIAPFLVYKQTFKKPVRLYYFKYFSFVIIGLITFFITNFLCDLFLTNKGFISLILKGFICFIVPNIIYFITFYRTEEFKYLKGIVMGIVDKIPGKRKFRKSKLTVGQ